jgi:hypothetical protein
VFLRELQPLVLQERTKKQPQKKLFFSVFCPRLQTMPWNGPRTARGCQPMIGSGQSPSLKQNICLE